MIMQMNGPYSISNFFILLFRTSLLSQNYSCTYQRVQLYLTVSVLLFDHVKLLQ